MSSAVDIRDDHQLIVREILCTHLPKGTKAWVFGSRALWTTKHSSDLDLAIEGEKPFHRRVMGVLEDAFEESDLPYTVDVVDMNRISSRFRRIIEAQKVRLPNDLNMESSIVEWRTVGEFAPFSYGKGLRSQDRNPAGNVPVFGSNGVIGNHDAALTDGPTIIIGRKGTVGAVHYSPVPCWPIDTTFYISTKGRDIQRFRYYALKSLGFEMMNADSAVPGLNRDDAHARTLYVPPRSTQCAIVRILGTLDDKIELNRRMNETLEAMAQALFKSWFVDFEPVRAKIEGRWRRDESLPGLPAEYYDLFPDRFVDSELGEIPEGWEVTDLGEVARQRRLVVKPEEIDAESPYIALEHMPKRCIALNQWSNADGLASGKYKFEQGYIVRQTAALLS